MSVFSEEPTFEQTSWQESTVYQAYIHSSENTNSGGIVSSRMKRVFIAHQTEQPSFAPSNDRVTRSTRSQGELQLLQDLDGMWSILKNIQEYADMHGGLEAIFMLYHPWNYLNGADQGFPRRESWKNTVLLVNSCPLRNSNVLTDLALHYPEYDFVVLSTWGAEGNLHMRNTFQELPNLR